ncbi:MAG TPA: NnrS family protein [Methylotenera sp.]|nr:NnrS family protein [Methylotenera sp.]HPN01768.1 NnrS family protein [Methylotenera sp.]
MLIQIKNSTPPNTNQFALFNLGFRPFFLGAGIFAIASITAWMLVYFSYGTITMTNISISQWHAHEMLYGYSMAVVAGFLLTAVKNWTGIPTLSGKPLMVLVMLWSIGRVLFLCGTSFIVWVALADILFGLMLMVAITMPIVKVKQWKQLAVLSKVVLLWIGNIIFYFACFGFFADGLNYAINGAILLFISLILMIGRRVIPFFIERGVATKVQLKQYKWLDISILVMFAALFINVIFLKILSLTMMFAWVLFILNGLRLMNWHTSGLWQVPLLWSLYLSAWLINLGFFFYGLQAQYSNLSILTLHIFAIGGIGLMSLSMMSRVALGHTGRDIRNPSPWIKATFVSLIASVLFRALVPMLLPQYYMHWMLVAAVLWVLGFAIFVWIYTPILLRSRVDGMFG